MPLKSLLVVLALLATPLLAADNSSATKELELTKPFLLFPIRTGEKPARIALEIDGKTVREFDAELAPANEVAFWAFLDVSEFRGQRATLKVEHGDAALARIEQADRLPTSADLYDEALRPQFHFSQRVGWNNDPNGLVYHDGQWHLYFQHNPYGWNWGNMHWGHAVSRDLLHWEQLPIAIYNHRHGDWAFSGGAVVDENNTAGWQTGDEKVIVASYTSTGRGECIAYSHDRGRTFVEFEGNPVVRHKGRDPKIIWYEPERHWVMAVYHEGNRGRQSVDFYSSPNLKTWKFESRLPGYFECPEIFELPVDGDPKNTRWVVYAADAKYALGQFDGKTFTPEHEGKHQLHHGQFYASQVFSNAPNERRIQLGWAKIDMPGMPFNQTFGFPLELTLRSTVDGVRLFAEPVREIESLHGQRSKIENKQLEPNAPASLDAHGELLDIRAIFEIGSANELGLDIGGNIVVYDVAAQTLNGAALAPVEGRITMRVLVDRPMLEIFGNDGRVAITSPREVHGQVSKIQAFANGGDATLVSLEVIELESIWKHDDSDGPTR